MRGAKVHTILKIGIAGLLCMILGSLAPALPTPEDELAGIFKLLLAKNASTEWTAVETIPGSKWAQVSGVHPSSETVFLGTLAVV